MTNVKALEIWTAQTICDIGILFSLISFLLHVGRPYFERILARLSLRVAADIWWLLYVVLRDGSLLFAVVFGIWNLNLDLMADIKIGLPFVPFGTVVLAAALFVKVFRNAEDITPSYRMASWLVAFGAALNTIGYVFVMEGPGKEYAAANTYFWQLMHSWRSNTNPELATITFYLTMPLLLLLGGIACVKGLRSMRPNSRAAIAAGA